MLVFLKLGQKSKNWDFSFFGKRLCYFPKCEQNLKHQRFNSFSDFAEKNCIQILAQKFAFFWPNFRYFYAFFPNLQQKAKNLKIWKKKGVFLIFFIRLGVVVYYTMAHIVPNITQKATLKYFLPMHGIRRFHQKTINWVPSKINKSVFLWQFHRHIFSFGPKVYSLSILWVYDCFWGIGDILNLKKRKIIKGFFFFFWYQCSLFFFKTVFLLQKKRFFCNKEPVLKRTGLQSTPPCHRAKFEGIVRCPVSGKKVTEPPIMEPDIGHRTSDTGHWTPDIGHQTLDTVHWTPDTTSGIRKLDHKLRKSEVTQKLFEFFVLVFVFALFQCPVSDVRCPMPDVQCPTRQCPIWCPMSDVRCPATWVTEQGGGGTL